MISFVWAEDEEHGIGYQGHLPWHLPADLDHFKKKTNNHSILMGRRTFTSLPHILPGREHLVLSRQLKLKKKYQNNKQIVIFSDFAKLKIYLTNNPIENLCVIGGAEIFELLKNQVDILEKTEIKHTFKVDVYMTNINYNDFDLIKKEEHLADKKNKYPYAFLTYKRK